MNVSELFRRLSYGELSNLAIGAEGVGTIPADKQAQVIDHANRGLMRLYSRFVLKERDLTITLSAAINNYYLLKRFAQTVNDPCEGDVLYITDSADDPFEGDLIKVLSVWDEEGCRIPLNDVDNCKSVFTPQPNLLQIPEPKEGALIGLVYQASHKILPYADVDAGIDLPVVLEEALMAYIASGIYSNMNGQENSAKGIEHLKRYEMVCQEVIANDLVSSSSSSSGVKFYNRGFV